MPPFLPTDFNNTAQRARDINASVDEGGNTLLHRSAQNGDAAAVERLLKLGANPNQRNINGQTPLYAAVAAHDIDAVKLLLNHGAKLDVEDQSGVRPLHWAIQKKASVAFVEQLRALGAQLETPDKNGRTALHAAAAGNNTEVINWLLKGLSSLDVPDATGKTPLHIAAESGAHEALRLLLEEGADALPRTSELKTPLYLAAERGDKEAVDILLGRPEVQQTLNHEDWRSINQGFTPLMVAVANGHVGVAEKLLDVGAFVNDVDFKNRHSLFIAAENGSLEMMQMLIRHGADVAKAPRHAENSQTMLQRISSADYKEKLLLLVEAGADVDAVDGFGSTALNSATEAYDFKKARALLDVGANPDVPNSAGRRPLDRALELPSYEDAFTIAGALLAAGASPDISPNQNVAYAPLHTAARSGYMRAVKLLLDHGASADVPDRQWGVTPWLMAAGAASFEICELLRQRGADTTARDRSGRSVLHYAARSGESRLLEAALRNDALKGQVDVPDAQGNTPLVEAVRSYKAEGVRLLLAAGADPLIYDNAGLTALHHLARYSNEAAFPLFAAALAKKGGSWNVQSRIEKQTPLHVAVFSGAGVENLLKQDVDLTIQDVRGHTPLMSAVVAEKTWPARALVDAMKKKKISVDAARDAAGLTALHLAVSTQYAATTNAGVLLDAGADINARTAAGDTPLHIAVTRGRGDIVQQLIARGADPSLANKAGATPLDLARPANNQYIIDQLQAALAKQKKAQQQMPPPAAFINRPRPPAP